MDLGHLTLEVSVLLRHLVGLFWTSDKPVAKASTYTEQNTTHTHTKTNIHASSGI
jgi:hypothetical protein